VLFVVSWLSSHPGFHRVLLLVSQDSGFIQRCRGSGEAGGGGVHVGGSGGGGGLRGGSATADGSRSHEMLDVRHVSCCGRHAKQGGGGGGGMFIDRVAGREMKREKERERGSGGWLEALVFVFVFTMVNAIRSTQLELHRACTQEIEHHTMISLGPTW
jgi:hypothetical protein